MKNILIVLLALVAFTFSKAQTNLVPNPSFELYDTCPNYISEINRATGWYSALVTPDYYNSCADSASGVSVPVNFVGNRTPASGNAYAGFLAREAETNGDKEAIGAQLITPLQIGVRYFGSFKVSSAGKLHYHDWCGINKLGILFSTSPYDSARPAPTCSNCAQICSDSIITDTLNWTRLTGSFVSDSNYSYISVGRFNLNSLTDSIELVGTGCDVYYYIDDICISTDSAYAYSYTYEGINILSKDETITIYPNPVRDFVTIKNIGGTITEIRIFNMLGELVKSYAISNTEAYTINLNGLTQGIYNLIAYTKNKNQINNKLIKQ